MLNKEDLGVKRFFVIASHHQLADGMRDTLEFIAGENSNIFTLSAYIDNQPVDKQVDDLMKHFGSEDEVIVLTDLMAGSVNQKFFAYRNKKHVHIISGINLPLVVSLVMEPADAYLSNTRINELIKEARQQIINVSEYEMDSDDDE